MADQTLDLEVFATGTYHGRPFTVQHLDEMVVNFGRLAHAIKPPLKLGHDDAQLLAGQADGDPALGWVTGLKRVGQKLIASVAGIPAALGDLIAKGRYKRLSSEVYPVFEQTEAEQNLASGVTGAVLSAVALLGADVPAVKTLADLAQFLGVAGDPALVTCTAPTDVLLCGEPDVAASLIARLDALDARLSAFSHAFLDQRRSARKDIIMADTTTPESLKLAELEATLAKLTETISASDRAHQDELTKRDAEIQRLADETAQARAREATAAARALHVEAEQWVTAQSTKGNLRLFPGQREAAVALYERLSQSSETLRCGEKNLTPRDLFIAFVAGYPDQKLLLREVTSAGAPQPTDAETWMQARAKDLGKDYGDPKVKADLTKQLFKERRDLAPSYGPHAIHAA